MWNTHLNAFPLNSSRVIVWVVCNLPLLINKAGKLSLLLDQPLLEWGSPVIFMTEVRGCDCQDNVQLNPVFQILIKCMFDGYMKSQGNQLCLAQRAARAGSTSPANYLHLGHTCPASAIGASACLGLSPAGNPGTPGNPSLAAHPVQGPGSAPNVSAELSWG